LSGPDRGFDSPPDPEQVSDRLDWWGPVDRFEASAREFFQCSPLTRDTEKRAGFCA
jgi:hypothetical protein